MRTIFKYPIDLLHNASEPMLDGPVRHVGLDPMGLPCVWIEGDPEARLVERLFIFVGTGQAVPEWTSFVGSFVSDIFVWHIYEMSAP